MSVFGIFVIETKNYSGWILGAEHAEYWTQNISGKADVKVKIEDACVVYWSQIHKVINQFEEIRLTWNQINAICATVNAAQMEPGRKADKQHLKDIGKVLEQKYDAITSGRCPRCGGTLVLRKGKFGKFYGCSNYPQCKYTHPA